MSISNHFDPCPSDRNEPPLRSLVFDLVVERRIVLFHPLKLLCLHEESEGLSSQPIPNLYRGIPPSACSGTSNQENPVQRGSHLGALAVRIRGGRRVGV